MDACPPLALILSALHWQLSEAGWLLAHLERPVVAKCTSSAYTMLQTLAIFRACTMEAEACHSLMVLALALPLLRAKNRNDP